MKTTKKIRSGIMVITKTGKSGVLWNDEKIIDGKAPVYLIDKDHKETGEKLLCNINDLTIKGFIN